MPFIKLLPKSSDKEYVYKKGRDRLDKISQLYYGSPSEGWMILLANPEYATEFEIPSGTIIRIPFPYRDTLDEFISKQELWKKLNEGSTDD